MRYGYDLTNPKEREMFFNKKQRDYQRQIDKKQSNEDKIRDVMTSEREQLKYFIDREKQEQQLQQEIEKQLPQVIEKSIAEIFKGFK